MKKFKNNNGGFFTPMIPLLIIMVLFLVGSTIYWIVH
jgi:hypothetical protein